MTNLFSNQIQVQRKAVMVRSLRHIAGVVIVAMTTALATLATSAHSQRLRVNTNPASQYLFAHDTRDTTIHIVDTPTRGGIREDIPTKYRARFERWKSELLTTELGREQWDKYANNRGFVLTITVARSRNKASGTSEYLWNNDGELVGATITLSAELEDGAPNPIYYPVLNSLSTDVTTHSISGPIIAAAKLSHELGHVNQASETSMKLIQLQNKLIPEYNAIFLENGLNAQDKKLLDLVGQMNGTPLQIWESREYWSEVNAMRYLSQRISKEDFYCFVFRKIKRNLLTYAKTYESRFSQHAEFNSSPCWK